MVVSKLEESVAICTAYGSKARSLEDDASQVKFGLELTDAPSAGEVFISGLGGKTLEILFVMGRAGVIKAATSSLGADASSSPLPG